MMIVLLAFAFQTASPEPPRKIDLMPQCAAGESDEIVVCADRSIDERYRLRPAADRPTELLLPKAEIPFFGDTRAAAEAEAEEIGPGVVSKRMMIRLKTPF